MALDAKVWGPHYWFVLHTIAINYPLYPNSTIKKKYYDFIHSLPLFIPISNMGNHFSELLDKYPVTPYLDSRKSFIKWMYFIHNKINLSLNIPEQTMEESLESYYKQYLPQKIIDKDLLIKKQKYLFVIILISLL